MKHGKPLNQRQQQHQSTLDSIRAAVDRLMREVGFEAMRIDDIVKEAGVSHSTFYHYFGSKNDIFLDRYLRANGNLWKYYEDELAGENAIDALHKLVEHQWQYNTSRVYEVLLHFIKAQLSSFLKWNEIEEAALPALLRKIAEEGFASGEIRPTYSSDKIVTFLLDVLRGSNCTRCMYGGMVSDDKAYLPIVHDWIETLRP
ncbi:TetR/AcrR family transcriptional regulator [Christensenellaceae bacterium OttesenSCG-928-M15]|nr:TetR/AcrR family transcriptional regulator [Christensenellaceae bacterium OttesenSCG-928-M15]